ncbi:MAG TPA: cation:proton antiporter [Solirubrobacteraceae bacterium]|nr:cation:proton antiporter [Solirubrobacteraceae bacterium]
MPAVHYTNLLIVVTVGLFAPLALGFFPRFRLPAIVLELVLGIVIGPSGLGWATADLPVSILNLIGLAFLLFLSGMEIDVERLRGRIFKLTAISFALSFSIAIALGLALKAGGFVRSPLFVAIVLAASSVSVIFPVLKDANVTGSSFGQLVLASASVAEFLAIILLSVFFSGNGSTSTAGTLILVGVFGLVLALVGVAIAGVERSISLGRVVRRLQDTTAQIRVRAAFVLMIGFVALADQVGLETILGAFAAGVLLSLIDRDDATHPQFRLKLEAAGFGIFVPVFFVTSGLRFNLNALFASPSTVARVPLFLLAIYLARALPAIVYVRLLGRSRAAIAGVLQATSLTVIVAAAQIGLQLGVISQASDAGLIAAGLLSVIISPALGLVLLRRAQPETRSKPSTLRASSHMRAPRDSTAGWLS